MSTGRDGRVSLNTADEIVKFAVGDKVDLDFMSNKLRSDVRNITIDVVNYIGG
jgi:hypothetical protein